MTKIINTIKKDWLILILIIFQFLLGIYFFKSLPNKVPIHWNAAGEIDGYGSKFWESFIMPLINLATYLIFILITYIDPRRKNYDNFKSTYQYLKYIFVISTFAIQIMICLLAKGLTTNNPIFIQIMISLIFILIGNVMGRIKNNFFIGIKTPWTLASEEVWTKTHRMAGPLWVIGGIINILLALANINFDGKSSITILIIICAIPIIYSYVIYSKIYYGKQNI